MKTMIEKIHLLLSRSKRSSILITLCLWCVKWVSRSLKTLYI